MDNHSQKSGLRKSITEFCAGGLFTFAVFAAVSFMAFAVQANDIPRFFGSLAAASAKISSPHRFLSSESGIISQDRSESDGQSLPDSRQSGNEFSSLFDKLIKLTAGTGWGPEEAPYETEEPEDKSEQPDGELAYPSELGSSGGRIIRTTYTYNPSSSCVLLPGGGMLRNSTDIDTDYLIEQAQKELDFSIDIGGEPQVLIMHTHTTECYEPYQRDRFDESFSSRTTDLDKSVVAVGSQIASQLEAAGIAVIHDDTVHDYPRYTGAYDRSAKTVEGILKEYPSIKIVIDVHRDAIESDGERYAPVCEVDGQSCAQVMIICGCMNVPKYRYNLRFASRLQSKMENDYPGFTRPILFAERNYNQELTHASILIEMGSNSNSLDEALYSGKLVGMSLAELLTSLAED